MGGGTDNPNHSQTACSFRFPGHSPTDYFGHPAEALATSIADPTPGAIQRVLQLLPSEVPVRGGANASSHSFTVGAFSKNGKVGVRSFTRSFPNVTQLLTRFVHAHASGRTFGAVACFTNLAAEFHCDVNNDSSFNNWVCPLSRFQQGGIWVERDGGHVCKFARGKERAGVILDVSQGPVELPSHCRHCVLPWEGTRCVLVAFVPAALENLPSADKDFLCAMGFHHPQAGVVPAAAHQAGMLPAVAFSEPVPTSPVPEVDLRSSPSLGCPAASPNPSPSGPRMVKPWNFSVAQQVCLQPSCGEVSRSLG